MFRTLIPAAAITFFLAAAPSSHALDLPEVRAGSVKSDAQMTQGWNELARKPNFWEGTWQITEGNATENNRKAGLLPGVELAPQVKQALEAIRSGKSPVPLGQFGPGGGGGSGGAPLGGCNFLPAMPMMMTIGAMPIKFFAEPDIIAIYVETGRSTRFIHLDGRSHSDPPDPLFFGESIGHWEGKTLVVDTVGVQRALVPIQQSSGSDIGGLSPEQMAKEMRELGPTAWPASAKLRIVERMHLKDRNTLQIDTTFIDDTVYAKPFTQAHTYKRYTGRQNSPMEWVCSDDRDRVNPESGETEYNVRPADAPPAGARTP